MCVRQVEIIILFFFSSKYHKVLSCITYLNIPADCLLPRSERRTAGVSSENTWLPAGTETHKQTVIYLKINLKFYSTSPDRNIIQKNPKCEIMTHKDSPEWTNSWSSKRRHQTSPSLFTLAGGGHVGSHWIYGTIRNSLKLQARATFLTSPGTWNKHKTQNIRTSYFNSNPSVLGDDSTPSQVSSMGHKPMVGVDDMLLRGLHLLVLFSMSECIQRKMRFEVFRGQG